MGENLDQKSSKEKPPKNLEPNSNISIWVAVFARHEEPGPNAHKRYLLVHKPYTILSHARSMYSQAWMGFIARQVGLPIISVWGWVGGGCTAGSGHTLCGRTTHLSTTTCGGGDSSVKMRTTPPTDRWPEAPGVGKGLEGGTSRPGTGGASPPPPPREHSLFGTWHQSLNDGYRTFCF